MENEKLDREALQKKIASAYGIPLVYLKQAEGVNPLEGLNPRIVIVDELCDLEADHLGD
ncbi:hypothetical protein [Paenibacillus xylanilyticus]|uniref:Uncharacterized protein n=1 Tax=Paenibacillus xylanilyticus TaxID=248903 RepID=A0A7Y6ERE4_9BACL|nr:hypothetical protein [Paenibacillus xylanilyticus]NUU73822.1 hypothetical protein [Paenibacillus xylanilyticus]